MKHRMYFALGGALLSVATAAVANDEPADHRPYLSVMGTQLSADADRNATGDNGGWTAGFGTHLNHWSAVGINYSETTVRGANYHKTVDLGAEFFVYPFGREFGMYTLIGGGQRDTEVAGQDISSVFYDAGIGFMKRLTPAGTQIRGDLRVRHDSHETPAVWGNNSFNDTIVGIGIVKPFGELKGDRYRLPKWGGETDKRFYTTLSVSHILADESHNSSDSTAWQAAIGTAMSKKINIEFRANSHTLDGTGGEADISGWGIDFPVFTHRHPKFSPYLLVGVGRSEVRSTIPGAAATSTGEGTTSDWGIGFISKFTSYQLGLRFDVRYRNYHDSLEIADGVVNIGFHLPIGSSPLAPDEDGDGVADKIDNCPATGSGTAVDEVGCPLDGDKDGVIDANDACPNTPLGTEVDARGCKIDGDEDGDGVPDSSDQCPDSPEDAEVNDSGCALDSDNDGVTDALDECSDTPRNYDVDERGCVVKQTVVLNGVNFPFNTATLTPNAKRLLNPVAEAFSENDDLTAKVIGHTDWQGNSNYNQTLSVERAEAVAAYLIERGASEDQLTAVGMGEKSPIGDNETEEGRITNRRVELAIENQ